MNESPKVKGILTLTTIDAETKEVLHCFSEKNVVTTNGLGKLIENLTNAASSPLDKFVFGNDVGTGTLIIPEDASEGYTSSTQNELFPVSSANITFTTPAGNVLVAETTIVGSNLMNTAFPAEVSINVTSGTFRFSDNTTFSYKRFPAIVISRMVDVNVTWEIEFLNI